MKPKTIKAVIKKKMEAWYKTIKDQAVRQLVEDNTIVTGGCIASMLLREKVNDYDVYFRNRETVLAVAKYYINLFPTQGMDIQLINDTDTGRVSIKIKSAGVAGDDPGAEEVDDDPNQEVTEPPKVEAEKDYKPVFLSTNAITLYNKIQIVLRFYGEPDAIHANYDFVHCTSYWESKDGQLVINPKATISLLTKELRYIGSLYPICSVFRLRKFIARGFTITAGQVLKMCMQISKLDLTSIKVLEDQLTGVDVAFFNQLIDRLKENDPDKVDYGYLVELIDKMF